jgi:hypothetical protein
MKCKELGNKYDVSPTQVGKLRKRLFPDGGGDLTAEEVEVLSEYFENLESLEERKAMEAAIQPHFVDAIITYIREGQRRAEVRVQPDNDRAIALLSCKATKRMLLKPIKLEEIEYEDEKFYRCAKLAGRAWQVR